MGIQNFPLSLQPIIQQGFLEREFEHALTSRLGYRAIADREAFAVGIGETLTKTRAGLKPSVTTPLAPATNTNLDNGLTPRTWGVEQYTITINHYASTSDLNMVTSRVGIQGQFLLNAYTNGEQAARSLDEIARNALFAPYFGGNTRVRTTLASAGPAVAVDDIRGFQTVFVNGVQTPIANSPGLTVTVGADAYTLVGASADTTNVSTDTRRHLGHPHLLQLGQHRRRHRRQRRPVRHRLRHHPPQRARHHRRPRRHRHAQHGQPARRRRQAAHERRPRSRRRLQLLPRPGQRPPALRRPGLPAPVPGRHLGQPGLQEGMINDFLGLRFIPTTEAYVQPHPTLPGAVIRRPIVCGKGALIEGDFAGMAADDVAPRDSIVAMVDGVAMVTREPIDRLQQIIAQSWYWIGGFCAPSDTTTNPTIIPTATNAAYKRAVMIEHVG